MTKQRYLAKAIKRINYNNCVRSVMGAGLLGTLSLSPSLVLAQTDPVAQADSGVVEEVTVTGIRGSLKASADVKRFADSSVDSVNAEDIGKFPDQNVAESLSRVPGVTISRDFGEGQGVTIRGMAPGFNITQLNGQAVGTAQWFVLSEAERNFNFEMLSSEMIAGVEVYKSAQADIDEGGLGGAVILRTRKPMDLESGTIQLSGDLQYGELAEKTDPSISALYSWKNDMFGVLVAVSHQNREVRRETTETFGFFGPSDTRLAPNFNTPTGASEPGYLPWGVGSALFQQERERNGIDLNLQARPNESLELGAHYFRTEMKADNQNQNFIAIPFRGLFLSNPVSSGTVENGIVTSLDVNGGEPTAWANHMAFDNIYRDGSKMQTEVLDFELNYDKETYVVHAQFGTTTGKGVNNDEFYEFFADNANPEANFDFYNPGGTAPRIDYSASPWMLNPTDQMLLTAAFEQANTLEDTEDYVQADVSFFVEAGPINEVKVGAKLRSREFTQDRSKAIELKNGDPASLATSLGTAGDFANGVYTVDHAETSQGSTTHFDVNRDLMRQALLATADCGPNSTGLCVDRNVYDYKASFEIEEDITALYVMSKFESGPLRGNLGVRYVETETTSNGYDLAAGANNAPVSSSGRYKEFLPSLNIVFDLTDDQLMRFSAGRAMSRPAPFQLTSAVNLTPETSSGSTGNPDLKPILADQFEVSYEWYFSEFSMFSAALFKKDIRDFIYDTTTSATINGVNIQQLSRPENGGTAGLEGIELIIQHDFNNGFGVAANYTYTNVDGAIVKEPTLGTDSQNNVFATTTSRYIPFPFASQDSYNLSGYYEANVFSARLNYSYRSEFFKAANETGQTWGDEQKQWDAQFNYFLNDQLTMSFEILNLTDETVEDFYLSARGQKLTATQIYNGRRAILGASYKF